MTQSPARIKRNRAIFAAVKAKGMTNEDRKAIVKRVTHKDSMSKCTDGELGAILDAINGRLAPAPKGREPNANHAYVRKAWALWGELHRMGQIRSDDWRRAFKAYVKRMTGVEDPNWMDAPSANIVIEGLKDWIRREGGDPA